MTNKDYKRRKVSRQTENKRQASVQQGKQNLKKIVSIGIVIVVVATVGGLFGFHVIKFPSLTNSKPPFTAPSIAPWASGEQISDSNFGSDVHIYYISWYGCPLGATDSWAFFMALNEYLGTNLFNRGWTKLHESYINDLDGHTPGLLFSYFQYKNVVFQPVYVYNQTMTGTTSNATIPTSALVSTGLSEINSSIPTSISSLEYKYLAVLPVKGYTASSFFHFTTPHVNTNIIITGHNGAWLFNGNLSNPKIYWANSTTPYTAQYVMDHQGIIDTSAVNSILRAIKAVA